ncbi:MAG: toll/interleukin-1 receptor domain-containing protein, partial [Anaerolineales bacterium]|nr:toll/interleukin-1 receptor domain-containing protein [Anaerolineales bacterium]
MPIEKHSLKVFLCHAHSDKDAVKALYSRLTKDGVDAWLDKEKLLPGQDWELEIRKAVREADVVVVCLSKQFNQAGFRQKEVRLVLDTAMEQPEGEIFIIPARLEECDTLESLRKWQWVDLFEENGYEMLMRALRARADKISATLQAKKSHVYKTPEPRPTKTQLLPKHKLTVKRLIAILAQIFLAVMVLSGLIFSFWSSFNQKAELIPTSPTEITDAKDVPMVLVLAGEFMMGSNEGNSNERPIHK